MTLNEWVRRGGNMLSNYTTAWECQVAMVSEKKLREMDLEDIYQIKGAGEVALREITRFRNMEVPELKLFDREDNDA